MGLDVAAAQQNIVMDESTRPSLPEPDPMSPVPDAVSSRDGDEANAPDVSDLPEEHRDEIRRLHHRVEQAVATIERLRAENARLRQRVDELEEQPAFPDAETVFSLDDDPAAVKERINRFIDAIDTYLEGHTSDTDAAEKEAEN